MSKQQITLAPLSFSMRINSKFHLRTGYEGPEGKKSYISVLCLTSALDGVGWSTPRPGRLTQEWPVGTEGLSGRVL
jgi:hypothetical protein